MKNTQLRTRARLIFVLWLAFLMTNVVGVLTESVVYASLVDTPQTSGNDFNPLASDVNCDGIVNILDAIIVSSSWGFRPGDPEWDPRADLNNDEVINILDMVLLVKDFGMIWRRYDFDELADWDVVSGTWGITNGSLEGSGNAEGLICSRDEVWKDCTLEAKVKIAADSSKPETAFCVRFVDSGNFYWAGLGCWGHRVSISRMVDHVPEELIFKGDIADVIKDVWYNVSIKVLGDMILLFVNDILELVCNDSTFATGLVGVRSWNAHIFVDCITVSGVRSPYTSTNHKLYVDGTVIKDSSGKAIRLQGFNVRVDSVDEEGIQWMKNMGFNSIRLGLHWPKVEPTEGTYDETYLNELDETLNWCEKNKIYVILDFHQWQWSQYFTYYGTGSGFPPWLVSKGGYANSAAGLRQCATDFFMNQGYGKTMRQKYIDFWKFVVRRYKDSLSLWAYEPINEPLIAKEIAPYSTEVHEAVMSLYEEFTAAIREIDRHTIIVYHCIDYGTDIAARKVNYSDIVWTRSWYDVAYDGYYPSLEYSELKRRLLRIKTTYNDKCETPFIASEMSFYPDTANAEQWIRDSFDTMRNIGLNNGFECWNWWLYSKGPKWEMEYPRNSDGSNRGMVSILQDYLKVG